MEFNLPVGWAELSQRQKHLVERYIVTLLSEQPEGIPIVQKAGREVIDRREGGNGVSYQLETVKCGKKGCKCCKGKPHGPYWYAYWRVGRRVKCKYLGRNWRPFDPDAEVHQIQKLARERS